MDGDILTPDGFVRRAVAELEARKLDFLIPYSSIFYLSEADSAIVRAGGGTPEAFKGCGGEDDAWYHIAATLGCAGWSANPSQNVSRLYHPDSGGHDAAVASKNPHYPENRALLEEILVCREPKALAARLRSLPPNCLQERAEPVAFVCEAELASAKAEDSRPEVGALASPPIARVAQDGDAAGSAARAALVFDAFGGGRQIWGHRRRADHLTDLS